MDAEKCRKLMSQYLEIFRQKNRAVWDKIAHHIMRTGEPPRVRIYWDESKQDVEISIEDS